MGDLHRGDGGDRARVSGESGEGSGSASLLDVIVREAGGQVRVGGWRRGSRDDVGAVDERALVVTQDCHFAEGSGECGLDLGLVVCGRPAVSSKCIVVERKR